MSEPARPLDFQPETVRPETVRRETAPPQILSPDEHRGHALHVVGSDGVAETVDDTIPSGAAAADGSPYRGASGVVDLLLRSSHQLRGILASHFAEFDLTDVRFAVLQRIREAGAAGCSQKQVADFLLQSESSISTLIERMRRDGLIYRLTPPRDRRRKALMLSDRGRDLLDRSETCHAGRMDKLLSDLSDTDRRRMHELLTRLAARLALCAETAPWTTEPRRESNAA
jgi:DNA-binding MarR family transcriptional regulator